MRLKNIIPRAVGAPYADQWELMQEQMVLLDYRLYLYYKYHQWVGPDNDLRNMLGFVVSREEFEHNLTKAAETGLMTKLDQEERQQLALNRRSMELRLAATGRTAFPLLQLFDRFGLDRFAQNCVILAYAARLDEKYERLLAYLQDDISKKTASISLAVSLLQEDDTPIRTYRLRFSADDGFTSLFDP